MTCFREALPVIEKLSCVPLESTGTGHDNSNAALMVANQTELMGNLEKLGDLMAIARTTVASTRKAQNLSAQEKFDQQALKVVELCVRVTSRCYDGDASPRIENQWTSIIASCKLLNPWVSTPASSRSSSLSISTFCLLSNTFNSQEVVAHLSTISPQHDPAQ